MSYLEGVILVVLIGASLYGLVYGIRERIKE